jgi:hypothetical protein
VGEVFECTDLVFACGGNRVLFRRKAQSCRPEYFLLVVSSGRFGSLSFEAPDWKSESLTPIAVSHIGERQEALLLMRPGDWVRSTLGIWQLRVAPNLPHGASLQLLEDGVLD